MFLSDLFAQEPVREFYDGVLKECCKLLAELKEPSSLKVAIGLGCEEGVHRSVAVTETLKLDLGKLGFNVTVVHRDITKKSQKKKAAKEKKQTWRKEIRNDGMFFLGV